MCDYKGLHRLRSHPGPPATQSPQKAVSLVSAEEPRFPGVFAGPFSIGDLDTVGEGDIRAFFGLSSPWPIAQSPTL